MEKQSAHGPKHMSSSLLHGDARVLAWACMAASGPDLLIFIIDETLDSSS